jgi:hypothetical protein
MVDGEVQRRKEYIQIYDAVVFGAYIGLHRVFSLDDAGGCLQRFSWFNRSISSLSLSVNNLQDPGNPLWRWVMKMYEFFGKNPK